MDLKGAEIRKFKEMGRIINDNSNKQHPLKVPHYQRPYKWAPENVEKLITDWFNHEENSDYFCGSIVTVIHTDQPHDLIDGQQRFTTLFLANFLSFMTLRSLVLATLKYQGYAMRFITLYDEMLDSLQHVILLDSDDSSPTSLSSLSNIKNRIIDELSNGNLDAAIEIFNKYFSMAEIRSLLHHKTLNLQYDRSSFNTSLVKVMCALDINLENEKDINFSIDLNEGQIPYSDNEQTYVNSIKTIFESIKNKTNSEIKSPSHIKSIQMAISFKDMISEFIDDVKVCIVQTGNPDDAYTLFEVLNDRALALEDLDLIKNEFYKNYVLKSDSQVSEEEKDRVLQKLDDKWVNEIFNKTQDYEKKLITFLAVGYITGSENIKYDNSKGFRDALKSYFNMYDSNNRYDQYRIAKDFNVFLTCKKLMELFFLKYQKKDLVALQAEYSTETSEIYKTVHLLYAKDQFGVLLGLTNFIFRNIESISPDFEISQVKNILEELLKTNHPSNGLKYLDLHNICTAQSKSLWKVAIMAKDYKAPRSFAISLINNNFLGSTDAVMQNITVELNNRLEGEFESWLRSWRYTSSSKNTLSIRILFARLIKTGLNKATMTLTTPTIANTISQADVAEMQLDHIEPSKINLVAESKYFKHIDRERFVNELGNMMPLPGAQNRDKSNQPVMESFKFFKESGLENHFILTQTEALFKENRVSSTDNADFYIPTEEFFEKRKEFLIEMFKQVVN